MRTRRHELAATPAAPVTYYTLPEAAAIARRTVEAMRQLRVKGRGPNFRKVDGLLLVSEDDLVRWLAGDDEPDTPAAESAAVPSRRRTSRRAQPART